MQHSWAREYQERGCWSPPLYIACCFRVLAFRAVSAGLSDYRRKRGDLYWWKDTTDRQCSLASPRWTAGLMQCCPVDSSGKGLRAPAALTCRFLVAQVLFASNSRYGPQAEIIWMSWGSEEQNAHTLCISFGYRGGVAFRPLLATASCPGLRGLLVVALFSSPVLVFSDLEDLWRAHNIATLPNLPQQSQSHVYGTQVSWTFGEYVRAAAPRAPGKLAGCLCGNYQDVCAICSTPPPPHIGSTPNNGSELHSPPPTK